nr:immunoglobulin light chain junction region [Macaca mulatta]MOW39261.1 immunoglobulin light chain junction region [Macaca mulatta]MOW39632.1 immunoglobulin light chain junction region [Macaca mulatta]MOW39719.1 immunoglobulin light chain junction region [Macaca mulatta]MOW40101.1 immunoglobulin light chain junction region [Macaca mulatta]
CQQAYNSPFTF